MPVARPPAAALPFRHRVRVYWEDTDAGGVVFYANYLRFFERARTEWLRAQGVEQQRLREASGAIFIVGEAALRFLAPARLDDALEVTAHVSEFGRATMSFEQQAWRGDSLLCDARIRVAAVDAASLRPCRLPPAITALLPR